MQKSITRVAHISKAVNHNSQCSMGFIYCVARGLHTIPCAAIRQSHWLTIHFVFSFVENRLGAFSSTIKMGSLFQLRRDHDIIVVETESEFFRRLAKIYDSQALMQAQADHHQDIDLQLVTAIDNLLVPYLGQWEQSEKWFHNIDCYGDGIRSITFRRDVFRHHFVSDLRSLLSGEFELFCIVCGLCENMIQSNAVGLEKSPNDLIAITSRKLLITRGLAMKLSMI